MDDITKSRPDFPTTHWSILVKLNDSSNPKFKENLSVLIERYWKPVYSYLRNLYWGAPEEAQDLTQEFFARMLEKKYLEQLEPGRGSFRGYLKISLKHFVQNVARDQQAKKRGGGAKMFHFEQEWARMILDDALAQLGNTLARVGKRRYYEMFREFYGIDENVSPEQEVTYDSLARKHGIKQDDVRTALRYARDVLRRILEERVREYTGPEGNVEQELKFLLNE
jgi:RNA polymerase sigma factor (sigma-70 family)